MPNPSPTAGGDGGPYWLAPRGGRSTNKVVLRRRRNNKEKIINFGVRLVCALISALTELDQGSIGKSLVQAWASERYGCLNKTSLSPHTAIGGQRGGLKAQGFGRHYWS